MIWQGWDLLVSPLMTGTVACPAISSSVEASKVRIMIAST